MPNLNLRSPSVTRSRMPFYLLALALVASNLAACNTIRGAGRDVSATGDAVADAAAQVQADLARSKAKQDAKDERERAAAARRAARGN
jgi:predicted small secreted protein